MNIFSGEHGLGAALTNPTELARSKGNIVQQYSVVYDGVSYVDVEAAYQRLKQSDPAQNDILMVRLIACKFAQHPRLFDAVVRRGGVEFLASCTHFTHARSASFQHWEGVGLASRFIRNLVGGFEYFRQQGEPPPRQTTLF